MQFDAKALMEAAFLSDNPQEVLDLYTQKENLIFMNQYNYK